MGTQTDLPQLFLIFNTNLQNANGTTVGISSPFSNLLAGDYILYSSISNFPGCTTIDTITVSQSSQIHSNAVVTHVNCNGGSDGSIVTVAALDELVTSEITI